MHRWFRSKTPSNETSKPETKTKTTIDLGLRSTDATRSTTNRGRKSRRRRRTQDDENRKRRKFENENETTIRKFDESTKKISIDFEFFERLRYEQRTRRRTTTPISIDGRNDSKPRLHRTTRDRPGNRPRKHTTSRPGRMVLVRRPLSLQERSISYLPVSVDVDCFAALTGNGGVGSPSGGHVMAWPDPASRPVSKSR